MKRYHIPEWVTIVVYRLTETWKLENNRDFILAYGNCYESPIQLRMWWCWQILHISSHTHTHNCMVLLFIMSSRLRYCGGPMWGRGIVVRRYSGQEDIIHPKSSCTCNESHLLKLFRLNSLFVFSVLIFFMKFIYGSVSFVKLNQLFLLYVVLHLQFAGTFYKIDLV